METVYQMVSRNDEEMQRFSATWSSSLLLPQP